MIAEIGQPDGIILNPPWGAALSEPRSAYQALGYECAKGQFDSYDLFVELALGLLKPGGVAALILPDSVLNPEHLPVRRLMLHGMTLELVARLGEGFFPSVYRGVVVLLVRKEPAAPEHRVRCFRLPATKRRAVLASTTTLADAAAELTHGTPQSWFARSEQLRIELDVKEDERSHLERFEIADRLNWRERLSSSRGVELSKHGWILRCPHCSGGLPLPRRPRTVVCRTCDNRFQSTDAPREQIVTPLREDAASGWLPLIAGEDVRRYRAVPSRMINVGVPGIAYKDAATFEGTKLLVRKTGVGLTAAVDRSGALTTQVVYHYKTLSSRDEPLILDYLMGLLSSRFILAYHLRTRGETEWRSHPYVTQHVIEELPIPDPELNGYKPIARKIADAARRRARSKKPNPTLELEIEGLVAELYGFDTSDWNWTLDVLQHAQSLEGIKELRLDPGTPLGTRSEL